MDLIRGLHWALAKPCLNQRAGLPYCLWAALHSPWEEAGGRQSSSPLSQKVWVWSAETVKDLFFGFSELYTWASLVLCVVICSWWPHIVPFSSLLGYLKVAHFVFQRLEFRTSAQKSIGRHVMVFSPSAINGHDMPTLLRGFRTDGDGQLQGSGSPLQAVTHPTAFTHQ